MDKKLLILTSILLTLSVLMGMLRLASGEDDWICTNGEWIRHGAPIDPKPTAPCSPGTISPKIIATPASLPCALLQEKKSGKVNCFGCINNKCNVPPPGQWEPYEPTLGEIGIPYSCFVSSSGCALAQ